VRVVVWAAIASAAIGGCRCSVSCGAGGAGRDGGANVPGDAGTTRAPIQSSDAWATVQAMPKVRPRWAVTLKAAPVPAIDVHGPVLVGDAALVAGSAIGIAGIDTGTGTILTERPAAGSVAIAALDDERALAVGDCTDALPAPRGGVLVGCYVVLDAHHEAVYGAGSIVATAADAAALGAGATRLVTPAAPDRTVLLGRDDPDGEWLRFLLADPPRGEVRATRIDRRQVPTSARAPYVRVGDGDTAVELWVVDDVLEVRHHDPQALSNRSSVMAIASAPGALFGLDADRVRAFRLVPGEHAIQPVVVHAAALRIDDLGTAVPGISLLAAAHGKRGYAVAIRADTTLAHDYIAAFTAEGVLSWAYPLPSPPNGGRALPVGLAMRDDAVVVFHDGTTVAGLPPP